MTITDPAPPASDHGAVAAPPPTAAPISEAWRDALVDLLVLAEHGDAAAAGRLRGWTSVDPTAQAVVARMRRDIGSLRSVR
ncbi:hypothetical protein PHK61_14480 [Actinomycetospora lutea]|uniref:hypothetical protein n=1 Tax=Actinomycetospora lutea TaxID=663604 RepID=UPI002365D339|nr:hypothetical protein [Actinomycetospora lutea]MDD7939627.1 hypothetical protein [Actinomycetospora lutea]